MSDVEKDEKEKVEEWIADWAEENQFLASGKAVNTNSKPVVGVRPDFSSISESLPYICTRSIINEGRSIDLDYVTQKSQDGHVNNMSMQKWLRNNFNQLSEKAIGELGSVRFSKRELGTHVISKRIKQILIPLDYQSPEDGYYSLSPLCVNGLAKLICDKASERASLNQESDNNVFGPVFIAPGQQIGGANPQNVGSLLHSFNAPLVAFNTPSYNESIRRIYRESQFGHRPYLTRSEKDEMNELINSFSALEKPNIPQYLTHSFKKTIVDLRRGLEGRAGSFYSELKDFDVNLEPAEFYSDNDSVISKGLIYKDFQDHGWRERFSDWLISQLERDSGVRGQLRYIPDPVKNIIKQTIK